jgi:hypothetical protein
MSYVRAQFDGKGHIEFFLANGNHKSLDSSFWRTDQALNEVVSDLRDEISWNEAVEREFFLEVEKGRTALGIGEGAGGER